MSALFEKRPGAPAGTIHVSTPQTPAGYDIGDGAQILVTVGLDVEEMRQMPYIRIVGGSETTTASPVVSQVFLRDGVLIDSATGLPASVESINVAQDEAIAALGGGNGAVPVFISDTEPDFDGAALWFQPGGGIAIQEA